MTALDKIEDLERLPVRITYVGETAKDDWGRKGQTVDQWRVTITSEYGFWSTDYFTGLGLRSKTPKHKPWLTTKPVKPKVAGVLYSLLMGASAADENFHDWCANYGYDDDSIKALNTYKACLETGAALRKHLGRDVMAKARELLQDY